MDKYDSYENPLITRYAGRDMAAVFSERHRITLFRRLWIALAEAEKELGVNITDAQIADMKRWAEEIDFDLAAKFERELRHDVMAHVHAYGAQAPSAKPVIHLGATSCYVTDNADLIIYHEALRLVRKKLLNVMDNLAAFALKYKDLPTLGFTHLQPAQLTTVGKRAALWLQDLLIDYHELTHLLDNAALRGVKGTTGTQGSFLSLFGGNGEKVKALEEKVVAKMGYKKVFAVSGQTYTRKYDYQLLAALSQVAQSASKFSGDLRLLQSMKEIEEPFEKNQIGSSAMAYKRNPMRSERIAALSRFVMSLPVNGAVTAGTQWLERTLDDSANRRIVMGQAFLAVDGILETFINVTGNLCVYPKVIEKHIDAELPFMATEEILVECVKAGGDRQEFHELIRKHSVASAAVVKQEGGENDIVARLKKDPAFKAVHAKLDGALDPARFVGRAPEQVTEFITRDVRPILDMHRAELGLKGDVKV